ncbi:ribonuclease H-like domain-containing protein [Mycena vitilis]|nr:ribonuclease H-like domain-containing protein [Mycena vitilis]
MSETSRPQAATFPDTSTDYPTSAAASNVHQPGSATARSTAGADLWSHLPRYILTENMQYITSEKEADDAMAPIKDGVVGFDTEFTKRIPTKEEEILESLFKTVGGSKKSMTIAWQVLENETNAIFPVAWNNIALCTIQIARGQNVWIFNLNKMKAFPRELKRILCSASITKASVGISNDVIHLWGDFRINIQNIVDAGLMAKLHVAHKYPDAPYGNLSLQQSVAEVLGRYISKEQCESDWKGKDNDGDLNAAQKIYAATDACASLKLYEVLAPALEEKARNLRTTIPRNWYTMDGRYGDLMRKFPTVSGETVPWSVKDCFWYQGGKFQGYP